MSNIFEGIETQGDPVSEEEKAAAGRGRILFVVAHAESYALTWQAGAYMADYLSEGGANKGGGFSVSEVGVCPPANLADGVYVGDLMFIDDGPGDWPGSREVAVEIHNVRLATKEEWTAHCRDEWPWESLDG